jgi:hypothetical protein
MDAANVGFDYYKRFPQSRGHDRDTQTKKKKPPKMLGGSCNFGLYCFFFDNSRFTSSMKLGSMRSKTPFTVCAIS